MSSGNFIQVVALQDEDGCWYVVPKNLESEFIKDMNDGDFVWSGGFSKIWGAYATGWNLNLTELWIQEPN